MKVKSMLSIVQCCLIILCLSACKESEGSSYNTTNIQTTQNADNLKSFSSAQELEEYSTYFWVCEEKTIFKIIKFVFSTIKHVIVGIFHIP